MTNKVSEYKTGNIWLLLFVGAAAGLCNGLLGCGGGIVIVYALTYLYRHDTDVTSKDIFATAVASILPMSAISTMMYVSRGDRFDFSGVYIYLIPAVAGGILGALLLDKIRSKALSKLFAALVMWAGISMILRRTGVL